MSNITSRATLVKALDGKAVTRTHHGVLTLDDWDSWLEQAIAQLEEAGVPYEVKEDGLEYDSVRYVMKPKVHKVTHGAITFTSQGHRFADTQGQVSRADWKVADITYTPTGFILQGSRPGHTIEYTLTPDA